jgi:uncharacterized protein (UPF0210 family)
LFNKGLINHENSFHHRFRQSETPSAGRNDHTVGEFIAITRPAFEAAAYPVQTARMATLPFPHLKRYWAQEELITYAQELESVAKKAGFEYISLGPALPQATENYALIPDVLAATENVFMCGDMTTPNFKISLPAVKACAHVIHEAATRSPDGFTNLRFNSSGECTLLRAFLSSVVCQR